MNRRASAYAQALYSLGCDEGIEAIMLEELEALQTAFLQEPDYLRLLSAANISKEERCRMLDEGFRGKVQPYVLNFLKLLTEKNYIRYFSDCCRSYREQYDEDNGILPVDAVTAVALTENQRQALTEKLSRITGKTIRLNNRIDPDCLGGVRLDYDGKRVDGTVRNRLDSIYHMLENTVL